MKIRAAILLAGVALGWSANGWRLSSQYNAERAATAQAQTAAIHKYQRDAQDLRSRLATLESEHYTQLESLRRENTATVDNLQRDITRLSIRTASAACVSGDGEAARVDDDAGTRADIHPDDAAAIIRITARADECRAKITGLQEWIRAQ